jgi:ATP-binding cassette subfamily F protein 3
MIDRIKFIATPQEAALRRFSFPEPEELSPPIVNMEGASVGYDDGKPVLTGSTSAIDQDDRIALLGKNGQGKSTLAKLIVGELAAMNGRVSARGQAPDRLFRPAPDGCAARDETPLEHLAPAAPRPKARRNGARGCRASGSMPTRPRRWSTKLSGGQKARLSLLLATLDAPHLLILDEPTNHLDIESREALVEALTAYSGAVVLVSHDMHLLSMVADRLWLVKGGRVAPFEEDLEAYRSASRGDAREAGEEAGFTRTRAWAN